MPSRVLGEKDQFSLLIHPHFNPSFFSSPLQSPAFPFSVLILQPSHHHTNLGKYFNSFDSGFFFHLTFPNLVFLFKVLRIYTLVQNVTKIQCHILMITQQHL